MRRSNKLLLSMLLAFSVLFTSAYAYKFDGSFDGNVLNISHDLSNGGSSVLVYVFDSKVEADTIIDEALMNESLIYAGIDKNISIDLQDDAPYGVYSVVLGSSKAGGRTDRIKYLLRADDDIMDSAIEAILSSTDADSMAEELTYYNNKAYVMDLEHLEDAKTYMHNLIELKELDKNNAKISDIENTYAEANEMATCVNSDDVKLVAELLVKYKDILELDDDIALYSTSVAEAIVSMDEAPDSVGMLMTVAGEQLALEALNNAKTTETLDVIQKYDSIFNVTYPKEFSDKIEYAVQKKIESTDFTDVAKVNDIVNKIIHEEYVAYNKALEDADKGGNKKTTSGGGNGFYVGPPTSNSESIVDQSETEILSFNDLDGYEWAKTAIDELFNQGIIGGDGSGNFRPADMVTREEIVKIIIEAMGNGRIEESPIKFDDVPDDAWYKPYIATASGMGIVNGISETHFGVGSPVTRQDAATMILRAADAYYITFSKKQTLVDFADYDAVSDYAKVSVDTLARAKIINGFEDGTFRPEDSMKRAEIAKVIYGCISVN